MTLRPRVLVAVAVCAVLLMLGLWFGLQLANGAATSADVGGVAYWAHAGGFIAGLILALPLWLKSGGKAHWHTTKGLPPYPEAKYSRTSVPKVRRKSKRSPWG